MNRNRSPFDGLWVLLFIFLFFGGAYYVLPYLVIASIFYYVLRAAVRSTNEQKTNRRKSTRRRSASTSQARADLARINVYLRKYYRTNDTLVIPDSRYQLRLREEDYRSLYSLDVYSEGRKLDTLADFRTKHPDAYRTLFDRLLDMAEADAETSNVVDAEIIDSSKKEDTTQVSEKGALYYAQVINDLNDAIPDEEISKGLYQTTLLLKQIAAMEKQFPDSKGKLSKLYQYYLPIQVRILNQYVSLQNVKSDPNYESTVENLKKTISLVNQAMEQLIADMSGQDFRNLSAAMSPLAAVLQKDGLTKSMQMQDGIQLTLDGQDSKTKEN